MILKAVMTMDLNTAYNVVLGYMEVHVCETQPCEEPVPPFVKMAMDLILLTRGCGFDLSSRMGMG